MGIIKAFYNERTREDKVWYDSSNVFFTRFIENENDNNGQLFVTFTNGSTYHYKDVDMPQDYILLKHGGLDNSIGKTLNKLIKGKYEFERTDDMSIDNLKKELDMIIKSEEKAHTYFISGHGDVTDEEFEVHYQPIIQMIVDTVPDASFVVGDFNGVDIMAQDFLLDVLQIDPEHITVYHMFDEARHKNDKVVKTKGGFTCDEERDSAMTEASGEDIAFIRKGKEGSCTAKNILRRFTF